MRLSTYRYTLHSENTYLFVSTGVNGKIYKVVMFDKVESQYNLGMGDLNLITGEVDDSNLSGNNDARKIFATIATIVTAYTKLHPEREILLMGNTDRKMESYSRMTAYFLDDIVVNFEVSGVDESGISEPFKKGKTYKAILVKRK